MSGTARERRVGRNGWSQSLGRGTVLTVKKPGDGRRHQRDPPPSSPTRSPAPCRASSPPARRSNPSLCRVLTNSSPSRRTYARHGSDVLIRHGSPCKCLGKSAGRCADVGTSATVGDEGNSAELRQYAADVFGRAFNEHAILREERQSIDELLGGAIIQTHIAPSRTSPSAWTPPATPMPRAT